MEACPPTIVAADSVSGNRGPLLFPRPSSRPGRSSSFRSHGCKYCLPCSKVQALYLQLHTCRACKWERERSPLRPVYMFVLTSVQKCTTTAIPEDPGPHGKPTSKRAVPVNSAWSRFITGVNQWLCFQSHLSLDNIVRRPA